MLARYKGRGNSEVPTHSQTSQCEGENSSVLRNSPLGRPICIALRSLQEGQAIQAGGDSVKVNKLSTAD